MPSKTAPKKKVVKAAVKKAPAKKPKATAERKTAAKKPQTFKALVCAIDGECFWTRNGDILRNLEDLSLAFGSMDDQIFLHHVTEEKNDFADWTEIVLGDKECAEALRKAKKRLDAQRVVTRHLRSYSS